MAFETEQHITVGSEKKTFSVTVPFIKLTELEVYVGKGQVEKVVLTSGGAGYNDQQGVPLEFSSVDGNGSNVALSVQVTGGAGIAVLDNFGVPDNKGSGYLFPPNVGFDGLQGGHGASAYAEIFAKQTSGYTITGTSGSATLTFDTNLGNDVTRLKIKRVTDVSSPINTFQNGSAITAKALNDNFTQLRHRIDELYHTTDPSAPPALNQHLAVTDGDKGDITVTSGGTTWTIDNDVITGDKLANHITIHDNHTIKFGTNDDLTIYHDNANSIIKHSGTGNFYLQCASDEEILITDFSDPHNVAAQFDPNGAVALHYGTGSDPKLTTASTGVAITGFSTADGYKFGNTESYWYESAADKPTLKIGLDGPHLVYSEYGGTGNIKIENLNGNVYLGDNVTLEGNLYGPSKAIGTKTEVFGNIYVDTVNIGHVSGTSSLPVLDFYSSNGDIDYDARIHVHSGNASAIGQAQMRIIAAGGIDWTGDLYPAVSATYNIGTATYRVNNIFTSNSVNVSSDERLKQDIKALTTAEKAVATSLKGLIKTFRYKSSVAKKGDKARIHCGVIAQEVKTAFEAQGLKAEDYALFCYDEWEAKEEKKEGNIVSQEAVPAGNEYSIRYDQLLAFIIGAL